MTDVIILAAGSIKNKQYFSNYIYSSPALIPINVRTVSSYIIDFYKKYNYRINLVINKADEYVVRKELSYYQDVNLITLSESNHVVDSLKQSFEILNPKSDVIINVVTTIPTELPSSNSFQVANYVDLNSQWSGILDVGDSIEFISKGEKPYKNCHAFTGVFRVSSSSIRTALDSKAVNGDLMSISEVICEIDSMGVQFVEWIDCGHEINYYQAKSKLISSRSFNAVMIYPESGLLIKSSKNIKKFTDEIRYIQLLPLDISVYFPSLYGDVKIDGGIATVSMEYYGYSTLAEYMLYWDLSDHVWNNIFKSLSIILEKFRCKSYSIGRSAYTEFYMEKTISRVADFKKQLSDDNFVTELLFSEQLLINGQPYGSFASLVGAIESRLNNLYSEDDFCIMHGDLCFNNILYDVKSGVTRLIDARGSFGDKCVGIYGDIKYDLAKLTHSVVGGYDFIVNNLFSLSYDKDGITYSINHRDNAENLFELNKKLISNLGYNFKDILFIVGLLFVSMCPLHNDDRKRQIAMYAHGIKLLNDSMLYME